MKNQENSDQNSDAAKVFPSLIEQEMKQSYLDYAMSVIVSRALPDVRDGLKPVHRRILYGMNQMGLFHNKPYKKSARVVGDILGKYHPHGDMAVYDSMVRMAQGFSLRYPLVQGQGNFGSVDGDSQAAMRYTEARMNKLAEEMLQDIDKQTVRFRPNFDGSLKEPTVLPSKAPNLLLNGASGIAVGMATNIPPHNLKEACDAIIAQIDNPDITLQELMQHLHGPDFPTGGIISGADGIREAYDTGYGKITIKSKARVEEHKNRERIIITEIPYQINKAQLIEQIAELVKAKRITGIADLRDESDREGLRIVVDLKKDANSDVVMNQLFKFSRIQISFRINLLALVDNEPKTLNLKQLVQHFISHRFEVVTKRTQFELKKAKERAHILEGLIVAIDNIDQVIPQIKASKNVEDAKSSLISSYTLTEQQAQAILDMKLQKLASLEREKIKQEHQELKKTIYQLKEILSSDQRVYQIIKDELKELKEKYGDDRNTKITEHSQGELETEDLIKPEEVVVTVTHAGYIKRMAIDTYRAQKRGGKGMIATDTKDEDFVEKLFIANTHHYLLFFTNFGRVYWLKVYALPETGRAAKGKAIVNLLEIKKGEFITATIPVGQFDLERYLVQVTEKGLIKKTSLSAYSRPRRGGIRALTLEPGDQLVNVKITDGRQQVMLATRKGMAVKFSEQDLRPMGRTSKGVRGVKLKGDDRVVGMVIAKDQKSLLTITENGYGKRSKVSDYCQINRGGVGVINIQCNERNGKVASIKSVEDTTELMLISRRGIAIRIPASNVPVIGRNTQGVRLMRLGQDDKVVATAKIEEKNHRNEVAQKLGNNVPS